VGDQVVDGEGEGGECCASPEVGAGKPLVEHKLPWGIVGVDVGEEPLDAESCRVCRPIYEA
jgi:hypothetical protein